MSEALDLTGLKCPLPALFAKRAIKTRAAGMTLEIIADDPLAYIDIPHMARQEGYVLVTLERDDPRVRIVLRR